MALNDKNLWVTPSSGSSTDDPKIVFSGADSSTSAQNITLRAYPTNNGTSQASWNFDQESRTLTSEDDNARWISGEERAARPSTPTHGMVSTPAPRLVAVTEETTTLRINSAPELTVVDVEEESETLFEVEPEREIPADAKKDGVTKRIRIPSWDDIMFGRSKKKEEDED